MKINEKLYYSFFEHQLDEYKLKRNRKGIDFENETLRH